MKHLLIHLSTLLILQFTGCQQEDLYSPEVETKENTADFLINNNSDHDISITYVTSSKLGFKESNGFIAIPKGSTKTFFDVAFVTEVPFPSSALSSLSFYHFTDAGPEIVTENRPIVDETWVVIDQALDDEGFGHTRYQLSYSDIKAD